MSQPTTRQEIYDRIRATSKDAYVLTEMKRLGYWAEDADQPSVAETLINREGELQGKLNALYSERHRLDNKELMLKEIRKQKMEESRRKRAETKLKRLQAKKERAENWAKRQQTDIIYLGENVSKSLNHTESDSKLLKRQGLPLLTNALSLAEQMKISVNELRFLAFNRSVSKVSHYVRFKIPKKTGGERLISAPMSRLKSTQHWILQNILEKVSLHEAAHGFVSQKSIVSNATPHLKSEVVVNLDMKDFFPTITQERVKGVFRKLGYSHNIATTLSLICTEPATEGVELDGETWYIATGERHLPQGAPTSPALTNILCRRLDNRLKGLADKLGFIYTRYADDMTFSGKKEGIKNVNTLLKAVNQIVTDEGLTVHPDKTKVMRKGTRQEVTGITVNETPSVCRKKLKQFRALLYQLEKDGTTEGKKWGQSSDVLASALGFAQYVAMVQPEKGKILVAQTKAIIRKIKPDFKFRVKKMPIPKVENPTPTKAEKTKKPWWKIW